ncbi:hypothetical protein [uncultured Acinetobacter sp.]|uniref:hypothetical protein n=1 Tax=uncultured Acinetobacter sp. TaxID=165433 RepID=UPI0025F8A315|nr:hypothetical protein [uncultured Acinetobacter sp.]
MNIHDLIFNLIKNAGYFILLFIFSVIVAGIANKFSVSLIVGAIILQIILFVGSVWIGYKNTKNAKDSKFKNSLFLHIVITALLSMLFFFTDDPLWRQVLDSVVLFAVLEIGSIVYYFKNRKTQFDEYVEYLKSQLKFFKNK